MAIRRIVRRSSRLLVAGSTTETQDGFVAACKRALDGLCDDVVVEAAPLDELPRPWFIGDGDKVICGDCNERRKLYDIELSTTEVFEFYSHGWTAVPVCDFCSLAIPVFVDEDKVEDDEPTVQPGDSFTLADVKSAVGQLEKLDAENPDRVTLIGWDANGSPVSEGFIRFAPVSESAMLAISRAYYECLRDTGREPVRITISPDVEKRAHAEAERRIMRQDARLPPSAGVFDFYGVPVFVDSALDEGTVIAVRARPW